MKIAAELIFCMLHLLVIVFITLFPVLVGRDFRVAALEDREYQMDRLEFVKNQLNLLIDDIKKKIKAISEDVESKVM